MREGCECRCTLQPNLALLQRKRTEAFVQHGARLRRLTRSCQTVAGRGKALEYRYYSRRIAGAAREAVPLASQRTDRRRFLLTVE